MHIYHIDLYFILKQNLSFFVILAFKDIDLNTFAFAYLNMIRKGYILQEKEQLGTY